MKKEFVRNPYNYDSDQLSHDTGLECKDESRTEQQHVQEADINYIAERFMRTGEIKQVLNMPTAGDFEGIFDFQTAMNTVVKAKQEFMQLPAKIRSRFDNDPAKILDFLDNTENKEEAIALGLIPKPNTETSNETGTATSTESAARERPERTRAAPTSRDSNEPENPGRQTRKDD